MNSGISPWPQRRAQQSRRGSNTSQLEAFHQLVCHWVMTSLDILLIGADWTSLLKQSVWRTVSHGVDSAFLADANCAWTHATVCKVFLPSKYWVLGSMPQKLHNLNPTP